MDSQLVQSEVILGVDTHLDTHVAAVISHAGRLLGTLTTPANAAGYLKLLSWTRSFGNLQQAGVEGAGSYGQALPAYYGNRVSQFWKLIAPTEPTADSRASQILRMPKAPHERSFLAPLWPFQSPRLA